MVIGFDSQIEYRRIIQAALIVIYKVVLDYSFLYYQAIYNSEFYHVSVDLLKGINAWIVLAIIYVLINKTDKNDSAKFMLNLLFVIEIIPLSTIYAYEDKSAFCFNMIGIMFGATAYLVDCIVPEGLQIKEISNLRKHRIILYLSIVCSICILAIVAAYLFINNGAPLLSALNFSELYTTIRAEKNIENKYIRYLFTIVVLLLVPYLIALSCERRKYILTALLIVYMFVMFLYTGHKTVLFSIGIFVSVEVLTRLFTHDSAIINAVSAGLACICLTWVITGSNKIYTFLIRRTLLVPAHLKFSHYEYFCNNEKLGFRGTLVGKLIGVNKYTFDGWLQKEPFTYAIGRMIGQDGTNCNTGVLIEGYDRFGTAGFVIMGIIIVTLLLSIRKFEKNTSHRIALITMSYFMYSLNDGFLLGTAQMAFLLFLAMAAMIDYPTAEKTEKS